MEKLGLNELRERYLNFFESKGHLKHKSYPLVPIGDKSLLLINAGMAPLKKFFTGEAEPPRSKMTTCQKCVRTLDIDNVGITARHGTFFEMLGNFSFGDYFKKDAISWAWEFLTKVLEMPAERLWASVYEDDDEAVALWLTQEGMSADRIVRLGKDDNFWEIGSGPCGPCSEIYFDRGEKYGCGSPDCKPGCDCDRYLEVWNLVFTQFDSDGAGTYTPLAHPNIDTGMGLERLACVMQDVNNLFEVDTVCNIMKSISDRAAVSYGDNDKSDISLRVITDHIRSATFLICDGVVPSNEGRGYILRRLIRRAARHGRLLGIKGTFLADIVPVVARENATAYPEVTAKLDYISKIVKIEEDKFAATIDSGLEKLEELIKDTKANGSDTLSGDAVFKLSDTFGFSIDLTREIVAEQGLKIDDEGYRKLMQEQKERARSARAALGDFGWTGDELEFLDELAKTEFVGYSENTAEAKILALIDGDTNERTGSAPAGSKVAVILDRTPFYAESGGQVGDTGKLCGEGFELSVTDTVKKNGIFMHIAVVENGEVAADAKVTAAIDTERRAAIRRNHSSVHMLQAALRKVLGDHVEQAGSYVDAERARFDFSHFTAVTPEELAKVEALVNAEILKGEAVENFETDIESAKKMGAMALFGEKYGNTVRVVKMGDFSVELCGGTHIDNTAKAGLFKIISESSVASGVRRIETTTGLGVLGLLADKDELIRETAKELKINNISELAHRAAGVRDELKAAKHEIEQLNAKLASARTGSLLGGAAEVGGLRLVTASVTDAPLDVARGICDKFKSEYEDVVTVLAVNFEGRINFVASCGKAAVAKGAHAGNILKKISVIAGGAGGGRPDSATSGGKDAAKIGDALAAVEATLSEMLK